MTTTVEEISYFMVTTHDSCVYRNGLTCGARRSVHPKIIGPEGAHDFIFTETVQRLESEREYELRKALAEERGERNRTFLTTLEGARPWSSGTEGRQDVNGDTWWACSPYPTWYRWDEVDGKPKLRTKPAGVAWA